MSANHNMLAGHPDTAWHNFYHDGQTPAQAVALAYADHQGHNKGRGGTWNTGLSRRGVFKLGDTQP